MSEIINKCKECYIEIDFDITNTLNLCEECYKEIEELKEGLEE